MRCVALVRPHLASASSPPPRDALAIVAFGAPVDGALFTIDVPQLGHAPIAEVWTTSRDVRRGEFEGIEFAEDREVLVGALRCDDDDLDRAAACVFTRLLAFVRHAGYPHVLRVWNHVCGINDRQQDGLERYRAFCAGRYDAFAANGYAMRGDLPAASAVGMDSGGLATYFVASREAGAAFENPRQVSAYDYPPQYGPRSPSFSRATVAGDLVFVSGTASVVGHETKHAGDVVAQLDETLRNLEATMRAAGAEELFVAKVYVRRADDYRTIAERLREAMPRTQLMFLRADICREDLLLEIDGVAKVV